jgi:CDP-4-dehydro-6-deoxyglucose reductase/ferredoxin-NAD(P)+ reductase (naphthalene dioxygenase ferredoxin-specific)
MSLSVKIRQWEAPVEVPDGETVLDAALALGLPYPHGCRSGNCGACKSRLLKGRVEMTPYSEFALTEDERRDGLVLACRSLPAGPGVELAWLELDEVAAHPLRDLTCRVSQLDDMTHDIKRLRLAIEDGGPFTFSAGQYAALGFDAIALRDYSMANAPPRDGAEGGEIEFHIRHLAGGASSAYVAKTLKRGETVRVRGPYGGSFLRENHAGPIVAVAGGSGLAPIKAIVETALKLGMKQPIHLYFGVRAERDLYLEEHFASLAAKHPNLLFIPVLSEPTAPTKRRTGFVHVAAAEDVKDFDGCKAYIAGPPVMVEAASALFASRGMRREDIHADAFYTEAERAKQASGAGAAR